MKKMVISQETQLDLEDLVDNPENPPKIVRAIVGIKAGISGAFIGLALYFQNINHLPSSIQTEEAEGLFFIGFGGAGYYMGKKGLEYMWKIKNMYKNRKLKAEEHPKKLKY